LARRRGADQSFGSTGREPFGKAGALKIAAEAEKGV
jgi:hypothetical protein